MRRAALLAFLSGGLALAIGCASSTDSSVDHGTTSGGTETDAGTEADAAVADPNGGRNNLAASCYAACQNTSLSCLPKGGSNSDVSDVQMAGVMGGCAGASTLGTDSTAIALDCNTQTVCTGATGADPTNCVAGLFSAFSFAFTPTGAAAEIVCTRD